MSITGQAIEPRTILPRSRFLVPETPMLRIVPAFLLAAASAAQAQPFAEASTNESLGEMTTNRSASTEAETAPVRAAVPPVRREPAPADPADAQPTPPPADRLHVSADLTITSQYFFRGIVQETDGFIFQPSLEISLDLIESDRWSLAGSVGMWNSFHDRKTGASDPDDFVARWYEADFYAGLSLTVDRITAALVYTTYASPNDAFSHINELSFTVTLDDSGWFGPISFAPYATIAFELSGQADGGDNKGVFAAVGIEPSWTITGTPLGDLTISAPIEAGFSLDDYFEDAGSDESFGYFTAGIAASLPLPFPQGFGDWTLHAGVDFLLLGDSTKAFNDGDDSEWIFSVGMGVAF